MSLKISTSRPFTQQLRVLCKRGRYSRVQLVHGSQEKVEEYNVNSINGGYHNDVEQPKTRKKLVILGTGWGSYSVLKNVDKKLFDVIVVSPRNHFLFTPLLASTTVGTLEFRSIIEPVRNSGFRNEHHFHLSYAREVDVERQLVHCESALDPGKRYEVSYDILVIGVGAVPNDFGIAGVKDYAYFLKVCLSSNL